MEVEGPQKTFLLFDFRHIRCGDLEWRSPEGELLPIYPSTLQVEAAAHGGMLPRGIRLVAQQAHKGDLLPPGTSLGRVIYDGGRYRSCYLHSEFARSEDDKGSYSRVVPASVNVCHVESEDGMDWSAPHRCRLDVPGQWGLDGATWFTDPVAPASERYKLLYMAHPPAGQEADLLRRYQKVHPRYRDVRIREGNVTCIYGAASPDGLEWAPIRDPLMIHYSDTDTTVYYDAWLGRYVMYTRLYWQDRRWVARAETADFRRWDHVEPLLWPPLDGLPSDDIYTNGRCAYPGLPGYHLMFPMFYHRYTQSSDIRLFISADGVCWGRVPGGPVLEPGRPGDWDGAFLFARNDLVPLGSERVGMLYAGTRFPHKYPRWPAVLAAGRMAWAWWPQGRLCAVRADQEGEFFTFDLLPAGRQLRLNLRTQRSGQVRVGLAGIEGRSVEHCAPIFGDSLAAPVHWKGQADIAVPEGQPVTLHFRLRAADLFGFNWV